MYLGQHILRQCLYFAIILACWQSTSHAAEPNYFNVIEKLHVTLLQHYNNQIRPVINHTQALDIKIMLDLTSFDFDDLRSRFSARGYFYMSWKDPRFEWAQSDFEGLKSIHLPKGKVWTPDLEVYNIPGVLSNDRSFASNTEVLILNNGTVLYVPLTNLVSTCIPDPTFYPFEHVTCTVVVGSWTHDALKLNIIIRDNATKVSTTSLPSQTMSHWKLVDTNIDTKTTYYPCCPDEPYQNLRISFTMQRSFSTLKAITVPSIAIMVLTLAVFFIPPAVSAKLFVGMINLAMTSGYLLYFHTKLPSGTQTPLIVSFFSGSLILTIISIVSSVFTLRCVRLAKSSPPTFLQNCLSGCIGRILGVPRQDHIPCSVNEILTEKKVENESSWDNDKSRDTSVKLQWMNVCLALDRMMFFAYCVVFVFFFICYLG